MNASVSPLVEGCFLDQLRTASFPRPEAVVEGLLYSGETSLIVGRPKVGKSRLTIQLALSLSRGTEFLSHPVRRQHRVLLLDFENRAVVAQDRFRKMSAAHEADQNIFIYAPETLIQNGVSLDGSGFANLLELVDVLAPDVLIIDTWRLLIGAADENRSEAVLTGLIQLSSLRAGRPQLVVVLVHHLRKQDRNAPVNLRDDPYGWVESVSGHHALVGHVDCVWGLERELDKQGDELIVFGGIARNAAPRGRGSKTSLGHHYRCWIAVS